MRKLEYISPSSIAKFYEDRNEFYLQYLSEVRAPRFAQTKPMSIGSAFDAYVKSFLHERLFGKNKDSRFNLLTLFEAQVEQHNRDWAWMNGKHAFECYQRSGALADLLIDLEASVGTPRFELDVKGVVNGFREGVTKKMDGVTLLGKPDCYYINKHGSHVILDWKVNGWCSRSNVSPKPGYLRLRPGSGQFGVSGPHKNCIPMTWNGTMINTGQYLEDIDQDWARQLSIYGWLLGVEIGEQFVTAIDQMVCKPAHMYPEVRIAEHRLRVRVETQWQIFAAAQHVWEVVHSDHIFRDMSVSESKAKCEMLDRQANALRNPATEEDAIFNSMTRTN